MVLENILFLAYVNDVMQICEQGTTGTLFADDVKQYATVTYSTSHVELQHCLDRLQSSQDVGK